MAKIDDFGGPAHLAWTPPKIENLIKTSQNNQNFILNDKKGQNSRK